MIPNINQREIDDLRRQLLASADLDELAELCELLSSPSRLKIIWLLRRHRELCGTELSAILGISQAGISQHLRLLREADLVKTHKLGRQVCYRLREPKLFSNFINLIRPRPNRFGWLTR